MTEVTDKTSAYLNIRREREAAGAKLDIVGRYFGIVSRGLERHQLKLSNTDLTVPIDIPDDASVPFDKWPDKEEVKALLVEYYDLVRKLSHAWAEVPQEHKHDLPPPDSETRRGTSGSQRRVMAR